MSNYLNKRAAIAISQTLTAVLLATSVATPALAGDTLFLKAATIRTEHISPMLMKLAMRSQTNYFVVQFNKPIGALDKKNLTTLGARIVRYLPDDALVVVVNPKELSTIAKSSSAIHAVIPFDPAWKESSELAPANVFSANQVDKYLVRIFPGESESQTANEVAAINGVKVETATGRSIAVFATRAAVEKIADVDAVEWIQPYPQIEPLNAKLTAEDQVHQTGAGDYSDLTGYESGTKIMNFDAAWKRGFNGKGQIASMADTGLDTGDTNNIHADFNGRIPEGHIFGLFAKNWGDPMGHGTHVSGSVVGDGSASGGKLRGGAYGAKFIPEGMWSPMLSNLSVPPKLADLFSKSYASGARIHTNSWGTPRSPGQYEAMAQQVDEYSAAHPDMLILFAAGNSGEDLNKDGRIDPGTLGPPSTAKNCLTVGASENLVLVGGIQKPLKELRTGATSWPVEPLASSKLSDNPRGLAAFSSRGPTTDGRTKPEIVSPGTNILSTRSSDKAAEPLWGAYNDKYVWAGGTSMATPLTAGAATVVRQYLVDDRKIANPSSALIKAVLIHTATDLYPGHFGEIGVPAGQEIATHRPNSDEGYGLTNMDKATDLSKSLIVDEQKGLATGETQVYPVKVSAAGKLTATLVYTDAPGSAGASKALVNDLDLVLVDASGKETTLNDHLNNNEMIEASVVPGSYEIRVKGFSVPQGISAGRQPYALVISAN